MEKLAFFLFGMYVLQMALTYFQIKNLKRTLSESRSKGIMGMGSKKRKLTAGNIVILVSNDAGNIIEGRMMKGFSVMARFKDIANINGRNIADLKQKVLDAPGKHKDVAMLQAIEQIENQLAKLHGEQQTPECPA